jgi:predicted aspartyl protease
MRRTYSREFSPPAPVVPILVSAPDEADGLAINGKLDTGADLCALPGDVIAELDLAPVRSVRAAGFAGTLQEALLYHCAIELAGRRFEHLEALATRRRYAIIGRNLLRYVVVRLDGPSSALTLTIPGARR